MLLQMEHQRVSLKGKKKSKGERGIIYCCPHLPAQRVQHGAQAGLGSCRPTEIPALDIEHTQLSPGALEGLELVPCCVMGRGKLPVPLPSGNSSERDFLPQPLHAESFTGGGEDTLS